MASFSPQRAIVWSRSCPSVYSRVTGRLCQGTPRDTLWANGACVGAEPNGSVSLNMWDSLLERQEHDATCGTPC